MDGGLSIRSGQRNAAEFGHLRDLGVLCDDHYLRRDILLWVVGRTMNHGIPDLGTKWADPLLRRYNKFVRQKWSQPLPNE